MTSFYVPEALRNSDVCDVCGKECDFCNRERGPAVIILFSLSFVLLKIRNLCFLIIFFFIKNNLRIDLLIKIFKSNVERTKATKTKSRI